MDKRVKLVQKVLNANDVVASNIRKTFKHAGVLAANLISSPGSGKTTLLEETIKSLNGKYASQVLVGDLETTRDADRIAPYAKDVVQINTGMSCHLYANQIAQSLETMNLSDTDFIFIENVGNMVCPGEFDLGENVKVILLSIPEGDDKVAKYPTIFRAADIVLITKIDLIDIMEYDLKRVYDDIRRLNENVDIIEISSKTRKNFDVWIDWLKHQLTISQGVQAKYIAE